MLGWPTLQVTGRAAFATARALVSIAHVLTAQKYRVTYLCIFVLSRGMGPAGCPGTTLWEKLLYIVRQRTTWACSFP